MAAGERKGRIVKALKLAWYIFITIGVVLYAYGLYASRNSWEAGLASPPGLRYQPPTGLSLDLDVEINNPTSYKVFVKNLWLRLTINNTYVGEVFKPYLELKPGRNTVRLSSYIDLRDIPCSLAEDWSSDGVATLRAQGWATVTLYAFGLVPVKEITVPLSLDLYNVTVPGAAKPLVDSIAFFCRLRENATKLVIAKTVGSQGSGQGIIGWLVNATLGGG